MQEEPINEMTINDYSFCFLNEHNYLEFRCPSQRRSWEDFMTADQKVWGSSFTRVTAK
jgi:hypothetical protein